MHGGPKESDNSAPASALLFNYFPVLAGKGYAVLRPNYRGSIGYGNAFYRDIVGGYFQQHAPRRDGRRRSRSIADAASPIPIGWS